MKRIFILLICFVLFFQDTMTVCAETVENVAVENREETEDSLDKNQDETIKNTFLKENQDALIIDSEDDKEKSTEEKILNIEERTFEDSLREEKEEQIIEKMEEQSESGFVEEIPEQTMSDNIESSRENLDRTNDKDTSEQTSNQNSEKNILSNEDPQSGRAQGYVSEHFYGIEMFSDSNEYIHNEKFNNYNIQNVIDVSEHQKEIDWGKVKQSGIDYAFIRVGFRDYGESGTLNTDRNFIENIENALASEIKVGIYFFSQAITVTEAKAEAEYVLNLIDDYKITLPVVMDYEYASTEDGMIGRLYNANLTKEENTQICIQFCKAIEDGGYTAMIYANKYMLENCLDATEISKDYLIWLAHYTTCTSYEGEYSFWQYTQSGKVNGISGDVDKSFWYEKEEALYNGVDYSAVYKFEYYVNKYSDMKVVFSNNPDAALSHFVNHGMSEGRMGNESFNVQTYKNRYAELRNEYGNDLKKYYMHYINVGKDTGYDGSGTCEAPKPSAVYNGVDYSSVYEFEYYVSKYSDMRAIYSKNPDAALSHFVNHGMSEGRIGNESFNVQTYKNRYAELRNEYGNDLKQYYIHYINVGKNAGYDGSGTCEVPKPSAVYNGVDYSSVYEFEYYVSKYSDMRAIYSKNPDAALSHFVNHGMSEGRIGNESFNVQTYKNRYAELRNEYGNDLKQYYIHYINVGKNAGYDGSGTCEVPNPSTVYNGVDYSAVYEFEYYVSKYSDMRAAFAKNPDAALSHFVNSGMSEGRIGNESFNVNTYRNRYSDLRKAFGKSYKYYFLHYINTGKAEGRSGSGTSEVINPVTVYNGVDYSAVYNFKFYTNNYSDMKNTFANDDVGALSHFVNSGMNEGRQGAAEFSAQAYKSNYSDLRRGLGDNWKSYYQHFINSGKAEGRYATRVGSIIEARAVGGSKDQVDIVMEVKTYNHFEPFSTVYIVETSSYGNRIIKKLGELSNEEQYNTINIKLLDNDSKRAALMDKFALAVKDSNGNLVIASENTSIVNPEALATNTTAIYQGTSKKGLQGITFTSLSDDAGKKILDARNANTKHTLLNLDLATIVSPVPKAGFEAYTYKGNTYYFDELVSFRQSIESLNAGYKQYLYGNNDPTKVAVTICLLLSYNPETSYLIDSAARTPGHSYYMLNVREEKARETFEALFLYLGEAFGQENCYVSNWILGNEINSSKAWNYSGSLDFDTYMECYATAFRLLYNGVKSTKTGNTVSISLDNGWTAAPDTYAGKTTLDTFAKKIHAQNPNIKWSIAYHPYSYPLTRVDFWNDYSNTTDSLSTRYISMRNISVLTNYAAALENSYGLPSGSIRVLLTEQGYSYSGGDQNQAMAIARGYYIAEFNDRIDAFIIRSVIDDPDEAQAKLYFGLMNRKQEKRIAFFVYEHMDSNIDQFKNISPVGYVSEENYDKFNKAKAIVCNTNWNSIVPGFSKAKLANIK